MTALVRALHREFGWKSRFYSSLGGAFVRWKIAREERRLAQGWTYEPSTFYEQNEAAMALAKPGRAQAELCRPIVCRAERPAAVEISAPHTREPIVIGELSQAMR